MPNEILNDNSPQKVKKLKVTLHIGHSDIPFLYVVPWRVHYIRAQETFREADHFLRQE